MTIRAAGATRAELVQLSLPMPLEVLVSRAINSEGADGCHERLVYAWEIAIQIAATSSWAVCRHLELRSDALDTIRAKLARPAFGHWLELLRATRALLADRKEAAAIALAPLLDGLEKRIDGDERFVALAERMRALPKKGIKVGGKTIASLLDAMPAYRNETRGHGEPDTAFRDGSVDAVLNALIAFARAAPLTGDYRIAVVHRLERTEGEEHRAELAMMEGTMSILERADLSAELFASLQPARAYLRSRDDLFVSLFPGAAPVRSEEGWALGWLKQQVRVPTLSFESSVAGAFSLAVERGELESLLKSDDRDDGAAAESDAPASALALDPWRGLLAYGEEHKDLFFGRGEEVVALSSRIAREGALVLCGASGSGKSSLMRAGLLPKLRANAVDRGAELAALVFVPGPHPLAALRAELHRLAPADGADATAAVRWSKLVDELVPADARAVKADALVHLARGLAATGRHLAVLVDQLEEAATLATDADERHTFLDLVTTLAREAPQANAAFVSTVRADKLGALLEHEGLRDLVRRSLEPVATLGRRALLEVVTAPLRGRRVAVDAGLAERIAADVGDEPGGLALVSQVLATLWDDRGRHGDRLTIAAYDGFGGVSGVLGSQAELARDESKAPPAQLEAVLVQLAQRGEDRGFTRRRADVSALAESVDASVSELEAMIEPFVRRRLLVLNEGTVEVAHETLLRGWVTLRELLERESAVTELRQEIEQAATAWQNAQSRGEHGDLWTDDTSRLRRAEELVAGKRMPLSKREIAFLAASRARVQRASRARRLFVGAIGFLLVAACVLAVGAFIAWRKAQRNEAAMREASDGMRNTFIRQAMRLNENFEGRSDAMNAALRARALEAQVGLDPTPRTFEALTFAVTQAHSLTDGWAANVSGVAVKPDAVALMAQRGYGPGALVVRRAATTELVQRFGGVNAFVAYYGSKFVLKLDDGGYYVVDALTGEKNEFLPVDWALGVAPNRWLTFMETSKAGYYFLLDDHGKKISSFDAPVLENRALQRASLVASAEAMRLVFAGPSHCHDCLRELVDLGDGHVVTELPSTIEVTYARDGSIFFDVLEDGTLERRDGRTGAITVSTKAPAGSTVLPAPNGKGFLLTVKAMNSFAVKFDDGASSASTTPRPMTWRGWIDSATYGYCPDCTLVHRGVTSDKDSAVSFNWGGSMMPLLDPCSAIVSGPGIFTRVSCDGRRFDFSAYDVALARAKIDDVLADGSIVASMTGLTKVWNPRWPSVAKVVAPPSYHGTTADSETGRTVTHVGHDLVVVGDREGKELWRFDGRGIEAVGRHGELAARIDGNLKVMEGPTHKVLYEIDKSKLPDKMEAMEGVAMDRQGRMLVVAGSTSAALFEPATGKAISERFETGEGWSRIEAVAEDGCRFALRRGSTVEVWNGCTKKKIMTTEKLTPPFVLTFSADGKRLVVAPDAEPVQLIDVEGGKVAGTFGTAAKRVGAISPDGTRVAAQANGDVCVWDASSKEKLGCVPDVAELPRRVEFASSTRMVVSHDVATRIVDVQKLVAIATVRDEAHRAALLGGDDRLVTIAANRYTIWKLGEAEVMRAACWEAHARDGYEVLEGICRSYVDEVKKTSFPELKEQR